MLKKACCCRNVCSYLYINIYTGQCTAEAKVNNLKKIISSFLQCRKVFPLFRVTEDFASTLLYILVYNKQLYIRTVSYSYTYVYSIQYTRILYPLYIFVNFIDINSSSIKLINRQLALGTGHFCKVDCCPAMCFYQLAETENCYQNFNVQAWLCRL